MVIVSHVGCFGAVGFRVERKARLELGGILGNGNTHTRTHRTGHLTRVSRTQTVANIVSRRLVFSNAGLLFVYQIFTLLRHGTRYRERQTHVCTHSHTVTYTHHTRDRLQDGRRSLSAAM